ncbi:MAG: sigma-70 family RNA polymerase sigma factor [Flavobacteriaceae bacterium]|nr:sigma-70 family RNA polymerase sigma factor [Flavobacteriaceae bacterium]
MTIDFPHMDNERLIRLLQNGSEAAYAHLLREHHRSMYNYALSLCGDRAAAQDIVQNVFFKTWEKRGQLKPELSIKNFLLKSTYNEFINFYHRTKTVSQLELAYRDALEQTIEDHDTDLLERKMTLVGQAIENLPKKSKETFLLSKKEGLTNIEIADYLQISLRTVEWHLAKAYAQLREEVGDQLRSILFFLFPSPIDGWKK